MPTTSQPSSSTSASLLQRVKANDADAWNRFAAIYAPLVYNWARRGGLQESDARDVVQDVFRSVFAKIGSFERRSPQAGLRSWLWVIVRNRVRLFFRQRAPQAQAVGGSEAALQMAQVPELWEHEEDPSTPDDERALVHRALVSIRGDFSADTWQAFWRLTVEGQPVAEIAQELKLSASAVRQAKYRVLCRLREELADF
jgi:RNA polymerase sigma-70 factor (ECF subfamily)